MTGVTASGGIGVVPSARARTDAIRYTTALTGLMVQFVTSLILAGLDFPHQAWADSVIT